MNKPDNRLINLRFTHCKRSGRILALAGIFAAQLVSAQVTWTGADLPSGNLNWSDSANWSGGTPSGVAVTFPDGDFPVTTNTVGAVDNIVDASVTISSLTYNNVTPLSGSPVHDVTTMIAAGQTLTVNGNVTVNAATNSTVNMAGTNCAFIVNAASGTFGIGSSGTRQAAITLADGTNIISVGTISVGTSGSSNGRNCVVNLGNGTNIIDANTINLGTGKASGAIQFAGGSGSLTIANAVGTGRATIFMGNGTSGSAVSIGQLLLAGHMANVLAGTVTIGAGGSSNTGGQQGIVTFDNGTFDATSILMAGITATGTGSSSTGTLTVGGSANTATLIVNSPAGPGGGSFVLSDSTVAHPGTGILNINTNGVAQVNTSITKATAANNTGTVNVTGGALTVTNGTIGTAAIPMDNLNITNATLSLDIASSGMAATVSTLNLGGTTNKISINSIDATVLVYPTTLQVIKYSIGNGTDAFNIGTGTLPSGGYTGFISNDVANSSVDLVVTGGPAPPRNILWSGRDADNGNATTSVWDINSTRDWLSNAVAVAYNDNGGLGGDVVTFDDTAATGTVTLHATVSPTGIILTNNILAYTINDGNNSYALHGDGSLIKHGSQKLTLDNSGGVSLSGGMDVEDGGTLQIGNNDTGGGLGSGPVTDNGAVTFSRNNSTLTVANAISGSGSIADNDGTGTLTLSGANTFDGALTVVSGGVLQIGNNSALGSTNGGTTIAGGAALDVNGHNVGQESVTISGTGTDSTKGAIYNSGASVFPALARVTLTGDTTIGGTVSTARWDLRSASTGDPTGASLSTSGNAYNLTKVGPNQIGIVGVTVDPNLANIDVQGGILSIEAATTGLGNPANNLTVESGATLQLYAPTNRLNKNIILQDSSTVTSANGNNTVIGPMTFNGGVKFNVQANGSLTLSNVISGTGSLIDSGTNTLVIAGNDSHSGGTTVNDGTFILNSISSDPNNVLTENASLAGFSSVVVGGNGTNIGPVDIESVLHPGVSGHPSTFGVGSGTGNEYPGSDGALMFSANGGPAVAVFDLGSNASVVGGGVNDLIAINGDLEGNFVPVEINPLGALDTSTPYTLVTYTGVKNGGFTGVSLLSGASRYGFTLNYPANAVTLSVSGGPAVLQWNNNANDGLWNVQSSQNWFNTGTSANDKFYNFDTVVLDDSIITSPNSLTTLTIPSGVAVSPQVITNNSTTNYTITGAGKISGSTSLVKLGSSTLAIVTTNDFTGNTTIAGGTVLIYNYGSLGAASGTVFITNSATLDVGAPSMAANKLVLSNKLVVVSGAGMGSNGAIVDNGPTNQDAALQQVTLAGDTTFGGSYRWDIRATGNNQTNTASLLTGGQPFNLTKVGPNYVALVGVTVDSMLADINVESGIFSIQNDTTSAGNPANAIRLWDGADLLFYALTTPLNKVVTATNAIIEADSGSGLGDNVIVGTVNITGSCILTNLSGSSITFSNVVAGPGGFTINDSSSSGVINMAAANTYSGDTTVNAGTLALLGNGSIDDSANITINGGATIDVSGRINSALTLNSSQTLAGNGTLTGSLTNNGTVSPGLSGVTGKLTVSAGAILNGTTTMKLDKNNSTNDVLAAGTINYGGTLNLTTLSGTLAANDQIKLFNAGTYNGNFAGIVPAHPNNDSSLNWDTGTLNVNGVLKIVSAVTPVPLITGISLNGTTLTITATNGADSGSFVLLESTNVALPLVNWTPVLTNTFDGSGNLDLSTNVVNPDNAQEFYLLQVQ